MLNKAKDAPQSWTDRLAGEAATTVVSSGSKRGQLRLASLWLLWFITAMFIALFIWAALADSLLQTGDLDAAASAADHANALDPASVWAWSLRAQLCAVRGELAAAIDILGAHQMFQQRAVAAAHIQHPRTGADHIGNGLEIRA